LVVSNRINTRKLARRIILGDKKVHEPAEKQSACDHNQKKRDKITDSSLSLGSADKREDKANKHGVNNHREKMALQNHFFFPTAISKASRAMR